MKLHCWVMMMRMKDLSLEPSIYPWQCSSLRRSSAWFRWRIFQMMLLSSMLQAFEPYEPTKSPLNRAIVLNFLLFIGQKVLFLALTFPFYTPPGNAGSKEPARSSIWSVLVTISCFRVLCRPQGGQFDLAWGFFLWFPCRPWRFFCGWYSKHYSIAPPNLLFSPKSCLRVPRRFFIPYKANNTRLSMKRASVL